MEFEQNQDETEFSWSEFERLDELVEFQNKMDEMTIPDNAYRQIKELNQTLIQFARELVDAKNQLDEEVREFELAKKNFESTRIQLARETTENRLDRILYVERQIANGNPVEPAIDFVEIEAEDLLDPSADHEERVKLVESEDPAEIERIQKSAETLKAKSEVISAVFVELDHMVRDLNRQQELLKELKVNQPSVSATELDQVNDKLRRRFRRLSKQIKVS